MAASAVSSPPPSWAETNATASLIANNTTAGGGVTPVTAKYSQLQVTGKLFGCRLFLCFVQHSFIHDHQQHPTMVIERKTRLTHYLVGRVDTQQLHSSGGKTRDGEYICPGE